MILSLSEYFFHILGLLLSFSVVFISGHLALSFYNQERMTELTKLFKKTVIGLFSLSTLYAIYSTGGHTILMGVPMIMIGYVIRYRPDAKLFKANVTNIGNWQDWFIVSIALLLLSFEISFPLIIEPFNPVVDPHLFYAQASETIDTLGIESLTANYFASPEDRKFPYHYLDLWAIAVVSKLTSLPSYSTSLVITYPLFLLMLLLGAYSLVEKKLDACSVNKLTKWMLAVMIFVYAPIRFTAILNFDFLSMTVLHVPRDSIVILFFLLIFRDIKQTYHTLVIMAIGGLLFSVALPVLYLTAGFILLRHLFDSSTKLSQLITYTTPLAIGTVFFISYYFIFNNTDSPNHSIAENTDYIDYAQIVSILTVGSLKKLAGIVSVDILYFILGIIIFILSRNSLKQIFQSLDIQLIAYAVLSGTVCYGIFQTKILDSSQFMSLTVMAMTSIGGVILISLLFSIQSLGRIWKWGIFALLLLFNLASHPSYSLVSIARFLKNKPPLEERRRIVYRKSYHQLDSVFQKHSRGRVNIAFLDDFDKYSSIYQHNFNVNHPLPQLIQIVPYHSMTCLSVYDVLEARFGETKYVQFNVEHSPFYIFTENQKLKGFFESVAQSQADFIAQYDMMYLIAPSTMEIPKELSPLLTNGIIIKQTGFTLYECEKLKD